ncbi:hypothetical protein HPB47_026391 [Ixodes persulcatus]|uniref:Uncharacterized protein n=1 Tax=Ixodes persulcatus TaxID=34615 RepID=A0AC60Q0V7_IXOPE|nr:hypothetical protein HPB47_026391 [Ixodes persulcatus]
MSRGYPKDSSHQKPRRTEQPPPPKGPTLSPDEKMDESLPLSEDDQSLPEAESLPLVSSEVNDGKASADPGAVAIFHWGSVGGATPFGSCAPFRIWSTDPGAL